MKKIKVIFYEEMTPFNFILTLPLIFRTEKIFILGFKDNFLDAKYINVNFIKKIVWIINKNVQVEVLSHNWCREFIWQINKASVDVTTSKIKLGPSLKKYKRYFENILGLKISDFSWLRFFRRVSLRPIRRKMLFYECALKIMGKPEHRDRTLLFIPSEYDSFKIFMDKDKGYKIINKIPTYINETLKFTQHVKSLASVFKGLLFILGYLRRGILFKRPRVIKKRWGQYMIWGLNKTIVRNGRCLAYDDRFLFDDGEFSPENILFIRNRKDTDGRMLKESLELIKEKNGSFIDERRIKPTCNFLFMYFLRYIVIMIKTMPLWFLGKDNNIIDALCRLWHRLIQYELSCMYFWVKAVICWGDQSDEHIVQTWVFNKYGMKTMGIQHSSQSGLYSLPEIAFVYFNKYCIYGDRYKIMFAPYWNEIDTEKIGIWRTDYIYKTKDNRELQRYYINWLKDHFIIHTSVGLSSNSEKNDLNKLRAFYEALNVIIDIDDKIIVIITPRQMKHLLPYMSLIVDNIRKGKIILENIRFTNYEWTSIADVVIGADTSSHTFEAICAGKYAFAFNFDKAPNPLREYADEFDVDNTTDMIRNIKEIYAGNWEIYKNILGQIRKDFSRGYDGKCVNRIKKCILGVSGNSVLHCS